MKIRKVREINYITILTATADKSEYVGKSFEASMSGDTVNGFKDWMNGNPIDGYITPLTSFTYSVGKGMDIEIFENSIAEDNADVVRNRLIQKLMIQYNELRYDYVNTENIGIPYLNKKTKQELDLILKSEIASTEGVDKIIEFNSSVVNRVYKLEFKVRTIEGEIVWLTIEQ